MIKADMILPTEKKWFDMEVSGIKLEEYRNMSDYYEVRLRNILKRKYGFEGGVTAMSLVKSGQRVRLGTVMQRNGYSTASPHFSYVAWLSSGAGKPEWGAIEGKKYFIFHIYEDCIINEAVRN